MFEVRRLRLVGLTRLFSAYLACPTKLAVVGPLVANGDSGKNAAVVVG